jgi:hypothetical protein
VLRSVVGVFVCVFVRAASASKLIPVSWPSLGLYSGTLQGMGGLDLF